MTAKKSINSTNSDTYNKELCDELHSQINKDIHRIEENTEHNIQNGLNTLKGSTENKIQLLNLQINKENDGIDDKVKKNDKQINERKCGLIDRIEIIENRCQLKQKQQKKIFTIAWKIGKWILNTILIILVLYIGGRYKGVTLTDIHNLIQRDAQTTSTAVAEDVTYKDTTVHIILDPCDLPPELLDTIKENLEGN